jgi:hypothetical protein
MAGSGILGCPLWGAWQRTDTPAYQPQYIYSAAGNISPYFRFPGDGLLECKGFKLDLNVGLGARANGYTRWHKGSIKQAQGWSSIYGGRPETAAAIAQTLILGRVSGGQPAGTNIRQPCYTCPVPSTSRARSSPGAVGHGCRLRSSTTSAGSSVPLVVRPLGDRWQVVGEAYVQGLMDGEALALLKSNKCVEREFTFC